MYLCELRSFTSILRANNIRIRIALIYTQWSKIYLKVSYFFFSMCNLDSISLGWKFKLEILNNSKTIRGTKPHKDLYHGPRCYLSTLFKTRKNTSSFYQQPYHTFWSVWFTNMQWGGHEVCKWNRKCDLHLQNAHMYMLYIVVRSHDK